MSGRNPDWLLDQLPRGMHDDDFMMRYLRIFQQMGDTYLETIDSLDHVFDPSVAPTPMIRVLGSWIGLEYLDAELPDEVQRTLTREYSRLVAWRGTAHGLRLLLSAVVGPGVTVRDDAAAFYVPTPTENEWEETPPGLRSHVVIQMPAAPANGHWASNADILRIVQMELPATVTFELRRGPDRLWPTMEENAP